MSDDHSIAVGDVFVDENGDEFTVSEVKDSGEVVFEDYYPHWPGEVQRFLDDGVWTRKPESGAGSESGADSVEVRRSDLDVLIYSLGLSQWLSPNADSEYAQESRKLTEGVYGALLTSRFDSRIPPQSKSSVKPVKPGATFSTGISTPKARGIGRVRHPG